MSLLKTALQRAREELNRKEKVREASQNTMRKATSLSKQAILSIHQKKMRAAKDLLNQASEMIHKLGEDAKTFPEIIHGGSYNAALQEYAEANILLNLIEKAKFMTPEEVGVPSVDYVLGLADVIGELRRLTLDTLREGNVQKSEEYLKLMDEIYVELMGLEETYMLVSGLRRKCDVARRVIEATRGDVTQEVRRDFLEKHVRRLENLITRKRRKKAC